MLLCKESGRPILIVQLTHFLLIPCSSDSAWLATSERTGFLRILCGSRTKLQLSMHIRSIVRKCNHLSRIILRSGFANGWRLLSQSPLTRSWGGTQCVSRHDWTSAVILHDIASRLTPHRVRWESESRRVYSTEHRVIERSIHG